METIPEEDYLQISGLQHYRFCPRQWALSTWNNSGRRTCGPRKGVLSTSGPIRRASGKAVGTCSRSGACGCFSPNLGPVGCLLTGGIPAGASGVPLAGREGCGRPIPWNTSGQPCADSCDALQLCAQAMCLEEMLCCDIPRRGALYGGTPPPGTGGFHRGAAAGGAPMGRRDAGPLPPGPDTHAQAGQALQRLFLKGSLSAWPAEIGEKQRITYEKVRRMAHAETIEHPVHDL